METTWLLLAQKIEEIVIGEKLEVRILRNKGLTKASKIAVCIII